MLFSCSKLIMKDFLNVPGTAPVRRTMDFFRGTRPPQMRPIEQEDGYENNNTPVFMQRTKSLQGLGSTYTQPKARAPSPANSAFFPTYGNYALVPDTGDDVFSDYPNDGLGDPGSVGPFNCPSSPDLPPMNCIIETTVSEDGSPRKGKERTASLAPLRSMTKHYAPSSAASSPAKTMFAPRSPSIAHLNLDSSIDASIEQTGITLEDIAAYVQGPEEGDKKWTCTFRGCNKKFGRKENIKSHVQTHLGDRQYKCNHCNKCFVRGHDLKRHAKIHTGIRPYPCECGNTFARQDALTRHKQRGLCSGAFDGTPRKQVKRGRPRKHRPELEERKIKAEMTKERAAKRAYATSVTDSPFSLASPLSDFPETSSICAPSQKEDTQYIHSDSFALPEVITFTPPASPSLSTRNAASPTRSNRSTTSVLDRNFLSLSPTKPPLDDIPEEINQDTSEQLPLSRTLPAPRDTSQTQFLLPPEQENWLEDLADELKRANSDQRLEIHPSAICSDPTQDAFDPVTLLNSGADDNPPLFSTSYSQYNDDFFNKFTTVAEHAA